MKFFLIIGFLFFGIYNCFAASGCLANNGPDAGKKVFTTISSGIYSASGISYTFSYTTSDPCHVEVDAGSTYAPCTIFYSTGVIRNGSVINYKFVNCPLDNYVIFIFLIIAGFGVYVIRKNATVYNP